MIVERDVADFAAFSNHREPGTIKTRRREALEFRDAKAGRAQKPDDVVGAARQGSEKCVVLLGRQAAGLFVRHGEEAHFVGGIGDVIGIGEPVAETFDGDQVRIEAAFGPRTEQGIEPGVDRGRGDVLQAFYVTVGHKGGEGVVVIAFGVRAVSLAMARPLFEDVGNWHPCRRLSGGKSQVALQYL